MSSSIKRYLYIYRFDIFSLSIIVLLTLWFLDPIYGRGHIVFSDLAFGESSFRYLEEIYGAWNERWSTSTLLNVPRLAYILPLYLLSRLFDFSGPLLLKSLITVLVINAAISMYLFTKRLASVYFGRHFDFFRIFGLLTGALFYSLNPWVIFRIQHIYLLVGYSLLPLVLMFFFNAFDPRFQRQLIIGYDIGHKRLYSRNVIDLSLMAFFFSVSAGAIHYFFYGLIFFFVLGFLLLAKSVMAHRNYCKRATFVILRNFLAKIIVFSIVFLFFAAYWLSMYVGSILLGAQTSQHNINVVDTLSLFSRHSSLKNVLYFVSYWWPMFDLGSLGIPFYLGGGIILLVVFLGALMNLRKHIVLFFSLLSVMFIILSTGVTIGPVARIFVIIVTKTPIIGPIFRDPNKIVGLMAIGFSVLLAVGVQRILKSLGGSLRENILKLAFVVAIIVSFLVYLQPFYRNFINGFYGPVRVPEPYRNVQKEFREADRFDSRILYVPNADNMVQAFTGVATPYWNVNSNSEGLLKATGDFHIYSSSKNTLFHHEGNAMSITYYMNFVQYLLDRGLTSNMASILRPFGANELAYHIEYLGQQERQKFNLDILSIQRGLSKHYEDEIFTLYDIAEPLPYIYPVSSKIITPYGYSRAETYSSIPGFNFLNHGIIYSSISTERYIDKVNPDDYIEARSWDDLFLSELPTEYYISPFDFIEDGNAFLKWSKTLVKNNDWLWFLSSQGISNFLFDHDFGRGVAVTFASRKLNLLPYEMDFAEGSLIADFDSLLRTEKFFLPDNPQYYSVQANPIAQTNDIPIVKGEIVKGDPENIWQVAKSGLIQARERNPYRFNIVMSGRGTSKLHVKVRFYDRELNELGVGYVVAPREESNFDSVNFFGEFVSPAGTELMRIDLLAFQKPQEKSYWWIHDVRLEDMGEYSVPNVFIMKKTSERAEPVDIYARVFESSKGGLLRIGVNGLYVNIQTASLSHNGFVWKHIGSFDFDKGENTIEVENLDGFNSLGLFAVVPISKYPELAAPVRLAIERSKLFLSLEAESELDFYGSIQSQRAYPKLSMGRGISSQNGFLGGDIEILKDATFTVAVFLNAMPDHDASLTFSLSGEDLHFEEEITSSSFSRDGSLQTVVVEQKRYPDDFGYTFNVFPSVMENYTTIILPGRYLTSGSYRLKIDFDSKVPSLSALEDFYKFDPADIVTLEFPEDIFQEDCSDCDTISHDMMWEILAEERIRFGFAPTCSCDWYDYASNFIPVQAYGEYLLALDMRSDSVRRRHMKVYFTDAEKRIISTEFVQDVEERYKTSWNHYEQILTAPEGARFMQLHILCRGDRNQEGFIEIENYSIIPYGELITVDKIVIFEGTSFGQFINVDGKSPEVAYERVDSMMRGFTLKNPESERVLLNFMESPNPLWEMRLEDESQRGILALNGVSTGFIVSGQGTGEITIVLRKLYRIGLIMFLLGFFAVPVIYFFVKKRE